VNSHCEFVFLVRFDLADSITSDSSLAVYQAPSASNLTTRHCRLEVGVTPDHLFMVRNADPSIAVFTTDFGRAFSQNSNANSARLCPVSLQPSVLAQSVPVVETFN
jgi:hypothetical protein